MHRCSIGKICVISSRSPASVRFRGCAQPEGRSRDGKPTLERIGGRDEDPSGRASSPILQAHSGWSAGVRTGAGNGRECVRDRTIPGCQPFSAKRQGLAERTACAGGQFSGEAPRGLSHCTSQRAVVCFGRATASFLSRREADIALRLVRPTEATTVVRKLGRMSFDLYASKDYPHLHNPAAWEFIVYDAGFADRPQQAWLMNVARGRPAACEIGDITGHLAAAQAGAGVAGLPCFVADTDPNLRRVAHDGERFARDIWMGVHRDLRRLPQVRAVMDFLLKIITENAAFTTSA